MVAEDDDAGFGAEGEEIFIFLDGEDAHRRDGARGPPLAKGAILKEGELVEGAHGFDAVLFFVVALEPNLAVRMGVSESSE
jgi:hypothetical protein